MMKANLMEPYNKADLNVVCRGEQQGQKRINFKSQRFSSKLQKHKELKASFKTFFSLWSTTYTWVVLQHLPV